MFPLFLLLRYVAAQTAVQLNEAQFFASDSLSNPFLLSIPSSVVPLTVSVALCTLPNGATFSVTNDSSVNPSSNPGAPNVFEIPINASGIGTFVLSGLQNGGAFAVRFDGLRPDFEVAVSERGPLHGFTSDLPILGDTTSNQAIVFSPVFAPPPDPQDPTYPNYTLPSANSLLPTLPSPSNYSLILAPTASLPQFDIFSNSFGGNGSPSLAATACALRNASNIQGLINEQTNMNATSWLRGSDGWRTEWVIQGLEASTNYTAFVVVNSSLLSGPIYLSTKSASFSCPLAHQLPYCPRVSYAVPLQLPSPPQLVHDASSFPTELSSPLVQILTNFTTTLSTFACGRDWYSPLQTCADCQRVYRDWLCATLIPRCAEVPTNIPSDVQVILPAVTSPLPSPLGNLTSFLSPSSYMQLLPCLETCNAVDRSCPPFLGFTCPVPKFGASRNFGVGYIDGDGYTQSQLHGEIVLGDQEWEQGGGVAGHASNRFGQAWCA